MLWGFAAARCGFPGCRVECVEKATDKDPAVVLGKIAHIAAHGDKGPRADRSLALSARDRYDNWILLCGPHHDIVDGQPNTYTVNDLKTWKAEHELWVRQSLAYALPEVGFAELEIVTKGILQNSTPGPVTFTLTAPQEKMRRNGLSVRIAILVTMGLSKVQEVEAFIASVVRVIPAFAEDLKAGFTRRYAYLRQDGITGDALFESLHEFASGASRDFTRQAAGLAVLMYLFERCEVFEP
jgi:hypothetical protein